MLAGLFCVLNFMLGQTARRMDDYQLVVKKSSKFGDGQHTWLTLIVNLVQLTFSKDSDRHEAY